MAGLALLLVGCSGYTIPPSDITETSAVLQAKAECGGNPPCYYYFRYRQTGTSTWTKASDPYGPIGPTDGYQTVRQTVSGLQPGTHYEYELCGRGDDVPNDTCIGPGGTEPQRFRTHYRFGPGVTQTGEEEVVFDYTSMHCPGDAQNFADLPARAFKDSQGQVQLLLAHETSYRMRGPNLGSLTVDCAPIFTSHYSSQPSNFNDHEWLAAVYTPDGSTVYGLVHNEYHGWEYHACDRSTITTACWYNAITSAKSTNSGATFTHPTAPGHLVASVPYQYAPNQPAYGLFEPSNIVSSGGYYYALIKAEAHDAQLFGACVIRTSNLNDPTSWRAWSGSGWTVNLVSPYPTEPSPPTPHLCAPVSQSQIHKMHESLTSNSHFGKWLLVGETSKGDVHGFYYSTSSDLINWTDRQLLMQVPIGSSCPVGGCKPERIAYPAFIDPSSSSRNFETTGRTGYVYFTRIATPNGNHTNDRDLVRIPVRFD